MTIPSEFTHTLTKTCVAQILQSTGFKSSRSSALETLTRITTLFLHHLSTSAATSATSNPALNDVVFALETLNFPLDFSLRHLTRFIATADHHHLLPFPHRIPKPASVPLPEFGVDSTISRRSEVPLWLPVFPQISVDNSDDKSKEVYWEKCGESCGLPTMVAKEKVEDKVIRKRKVGKGEILVYGRRQRVKFKLGVKRKTKAEASNVDDLELRNGVCRGGKRICLIKRGNSNSIFDDEDEGE